MKNLSVFLILAGTILFPPALAQAQTGPGGQERPLDELIVLRHTKTARISSYDRSGGNLDFVVIAPGETQTLAEIPGASIIRRFYLAPFALDRIRYRKMLLRIYWDGQKTLASKSLSETFLDRGLGRYATSIPSPWT